VVDRLELTDEVDGELATGFLRASQRCTVASRSSASAAVGGLQGSDGRASAGKPPGGNRAAATRVGDRQLRVWRCAVGRHGWGAPGDLPCPVSGRVTAAGAWSRADTMRGGSDVGDEVRALP
jgi:hypothetical protein